MVHNIRETLGKSRNYVDTVQWGAPGLHTYIQEHGVPSKPTRENQVREPK